MFASIAFVLTTAPSVSLPEPTASPSIEAFASASMACLAATQTEETDERVIESRDWVRSPEQAYPLDRSVTFSREGTAVDLYVLKPEKQCLVMWLVKSSADDAALIEAVFEAVKDQVTSEFRGATDGLLGTARNSDFLRFELVSTWGDLRAGGRDGTMAFSFLAMNKENLERVQSAQAVSPPQPSEDSRDQ